MNTAIFDKPFFEVTLSLMLTIISGIGAMISTNNRRLDEVVQKLWRIETLLSDHEQRIVTVEERTSLFAHR